MSDEESVMMEERSPLIKVDVDRKDEVFLVKITVSGIDIPSVTMTMDEILGFKVDLTDSVDAITQVTEIDPCPLCKGKVIYKSKIPILPSEIIGGRFVCTVCRMKIDSPFKHYIDSVSWWNSGRKFKIPHKKP